jgi:hypothetical protein
MEWEVWPESNPSLVHCAIDWSGCTLTTLVSDSGHSEFFVLLSTRIIKSPLPGLIPSSGDNHDDDVVQAWSSGLLPHWQDDGIRVEYPRDALQDDIAPGGHWAQGQLHRCRFGESVRECRPDDNLSESGLGGTCSDGEEDTYHLCYITGTRWRWHHWCCPSDDIKLYH